MVRYFPYLVRIIFGIYKNYRRFYTIAAVILFLRLPPRKDEKAAEYVYPAAFSVKIFGEKKEFKYIFNKSVI